MSDFLELTVAKVNSEERLSEFFWLDDNIFIYLFIYLLIYLFIYVVVKHVFAFWCVSLSVITLSFAYFDLHLTHFPRNTLVYMYILPFFTNHASFIAVDKGISGEFFIFSTQKYVL